MDDLCLAGPIYFLRKARKVNDIYALCLASHDEAN